MATFLYQPIDRLRNEIRLVHVLPSPDSAPRVECSLVHVSLDEQPVYQALSYTWDSNVFSGNILLDGSPFAVTANLELALLRIRHPTEVVALWADAICINQKDVVERNHEVLRMLDIYQRAHLVRIWLGDAADNSDLAFDHLEKLASEWDHFRTTRHRLQDNARWLVWLMVTMCQFSWILTRSFVTTMFGNNKLTTLIFLAYHVEMRGNLIARVSIYIPFAIMFVRSLVAAVPLWWRASPWMVREQPFVPPDTATTSALKQLFQRSWWRRTWVIQEMVAARNAMVICGRRSMALPRLCDAAQHISYRVQLSPDERLDPYGSVAFQCIMGFISVLGIDTLPSEIQQRYTSLLFLANQFANAEAGDPRDKVYALLGLATDHVKVVPDYSKSVVEVYINTAQEIIRSTGNLDVLRACEKQGSMVDLPSWVPDWTAKAAKSVGGMESFREPYTFSADGALPDSVASRVVANFSADGKRMCARGVIVCTIDGEPTVHFVDGQLDLSWAKAYALPLEFLWPLRRVWITCFMLFCRVSGLRWVFMYLAKRDVYKIGYVFWYFALSIDAGNLQRHAKRTSPKSDHSSSVDALLRSVAGEDRRKRTVKSWTISADVPLLQDAVTVRTDGHRAGPGCKVVFFIGAKVPFLIKKVEGQEAENVYMLVGSTSFLETTFDTAVWEDVKRRTKLGELKLENIELV